MRRVCLGICLSFAVLASPATSLAQNPTATNQPPDKPALVAASTESASAPAIVRPPSFKALFSSVGQDFRQFASRQNLLFLGVGLSAAASSHAFDNHIARTGWGAGMVEETLEPGQVIGGTLAQLGGAFATYTLGRTVHSPRLATFGAELFRAQLLSEGVTQAVKFGVRRTRPDGTSLSFPSGHTASAFATATVIRANFGWKAGIPAYAIASMIGASRMQMDRHYLSDVIAGATVGILAGRSVTVGTGSARFSVSPMAAHGGLGVSFIKK